jgi:hypothetical protein
MNKIYIRPTPRFEPQLIQKTNLYLRTLMKFYENRDLKQSEATLSSKLIKKNSSETQSDVLGSQE